MRKLPLRILAITAMIFLVACQESPRSNTTNSTADQNLQTLDTRIGALEFENDYLVGIPTENTRNKIFDEIDFQRASQAYIWSIPMTSFYAWKQSLYDMGGEDGQIHFFESYDSKLGGLTYNTSTPYVIAFINVAEQPTMITIPTNEVRGAVHNAWQIGLSQMTEPGQYVIVPKGTEPPANMPANAKLVVSDTSYVFLGVRLMSKDAKQREKDLENMKISNLDGESLSSKPVNRPVMGLDGKHPRGMAFWSILDEAIQAEPVHERDRMMHDMLRPLGIEKGKAFAPDARQKKILEESVVIGEIMAKNIVM